jgi:hypothetical protein
MHKIVIVWLILSIILIGKLNDSCIEECMENNSEEVCYNVCRP